MPASISCHLAGVKSNEYEKEYIKKDGTIFPISCKGWLIKDKKEKPMGMLGFVRDITERKRIEEQLQIRQRMDSIGTLAGGIAHDFNNLLPVLRLFQDLIIPDESLMEQQLNKILRV